MIDRQQGLEAGQPENLREIERAAIELAALAGAEISMALGGLLTVRYKGASETDEVWRDPVSEVDQRIEQVIRDRIARRFPEHGIIGEEFEGETVERRDTVWAIDPIDGTANFVNGFPLFAASIGVLWRGEPVVGAIWCSTSHALRAGVYHARRGGVPRFDFDVVDISPNQDVRRRLAGFGAPPPVGTSLPWEIRKTGSAAVECAFVAAGLLDVSRFDTPNVWDVAAGAVLVKAAGGEIRVRGGGHWNPFSGFFRDGEETADLRQWTCPMVLGRSDAVAEMCGIAD
jgi:myo-inositol-1(or 4)-monophosphatase